MSWKKAKLMGIKSINPKLKQFRIARELKDSSSTLQQYQRKIDMFSPFRIPPSINNHTQKKKQDFKSC